MYQSATTRIAGGMSKAPRMGQSLALLVIADFYCNGSTSIEHDIHMCRLKFKVSSDTDRTISTRFTIFYNEEFVLATLNLSA